VTQVKKSSNAKLKQACESALTDIGDGSQKVGGEHRAYVLLCTHTHTHTLSLSLSLSRP
jgi:hypothetical protein